MSTLRLGRSGIYVLVGTNFLLSSPVRPPILRPNHLQGTGVPSRGLSDPGVNISLPSSAEVKTVWSRTSTPDIGKSYAFMLWTRKAFNFTKLMT